MKVTLIDSPVANVANIARALRACGAELQMSRDADEIRRADRIVLPGVGSFAAAMSWLVETRVDVALRDAVANGASLLGICVGHQLLFDVSHEHGTTPGLGLLRGEVRKLEGSLPVPQIGWNRVRAALDCGGKAAALTRGSVSCRGSAAALRAAALLPQSRLFEGIPDGTPFYFVNSFAVRNAADEIAAADYDGSFTAAAGQGRVFGVQFHPEKSSTAGLRVLRNFIACN